MGEEKELGGSLLKRNADRKQNLADLKTWWDGAFQRHSHSSAKNILNAALVIFGALPTVGIAVWVLSCNPTPNNGNVDDLHTMKEAYESSFRSLLYWSPLFLINFVFFINVDIIFYIIGLLQRSFWLIDPYWTLFPSIFGLIWASHPMAVVNARTIVANILTLIWAIRLTHSYFRRENWKFGEREDWRYTKMAMEHGKPLWYLISFFTVGVAQHPMLVGISLPLYSVAFGPYAKHSSFDWIDGIITVLCLTGITIACIADNQLRSFMMENESRRSQGLPKIRLLRKGLWRYSRHPNYFGEQMWWWSLALFSLKVGQYWAIAGTALNSLVLAIVTVMTESKMLREWPPERAALYKQYQKEVSACFPWFLFGRDKSSGDEDQDI